MNMLMSKGLTLTDTNVLKKLVQSLKMVKTGVLDNGN